jgi:2-polyprenyl-3-methyl-5-hydroxy-6-metoxy-1,4-benzoquinol methylase
MFSLGEQDIHDETLSFYRANALQYFTDTIGLNTGKLRDRFLALVPPGSHIVDLGCGSGRDSQHFLSLGFRVTAIDACQELASLAEKAIGQPVIVERIESVVLEEPADGIWACASLLHVRRRDLSLVLCNLSRSLKIGGVLYASFKHGKSERLEGQRLMTDLNEEGVMALVRDCDRFGLFDLWLSTDVRPQANGNLWTNIILRRTN